MRKKLIMAGIVLVLSGCSGFMDKVSNLQRDSVNYPASMALTDRCITDAAEQHGYRLDKIHSEPGKLNQYQLRKSDVDIKISIDIQGLGRYTSTTLSYDRRDGATANDVNAILGYCKKELG